MRPHQIFAAMTSDHAEKIFERIAEHAPDMFDQCVAAAAANMKARPRFLMKQPFPKRSAAVRRSLSRFAADPIAEEMLAVYYLQCRNELLCEWLDDIGLEHEKGALAEDCPAEPDASKLEKTVEAFRAKQDDPDRELLLRAFAAQEAIRWPELDALIAAVADRVAS